MALKQSQRASLAVLTPLYNIKKFIQFRRRVQEFLSDLILPSLLIAKEGPGTCSRLRGRWGPPERVTPRRSYAHHNEGFFEVEAFESGLDEGGAEMPPCSEWDPRQGDERRGALRDRTLIRRLNILGASDRIQPRKGGQMLKKHPRGLAFVFFTEIWERLGFYTLMAILVLYMDKTLGWPDSKKGDYYGIFLALCYFVPVLGGWIGDRLLGQLRSVRTGAALMAVGYVGLALSSASQVATFYAGLFLIAVGTGIFKVNQAVLVGNLYADRPRLKDAGFNIFYMGVNIGAAIAPLMATFISATYGSYNISFWVCAAGLVIALVIFQTGRRELAKFDNKLMGRPGAARIVTEARPEMSGAEIRQRVVTLVTLFLIVIFFWVGFYQNGFALTLFAERSTRVYKFLRPETYQFFDPFFIIVLTPLLLSLFSRMNRRGTEPSTPVKIFAGMLIMAVSMIVMVIACLSGGDRDQNIMSPSWLIGTYFIVTIAEILISPMGQSFVSKVAPPKFQGLMMGGWFAATAAGSYGSGVLGKFYSDFAHHQYFLLLTGLLALSAGLVLLFLKKLRRFSA
jgi:POT family proton-dependent oligopeptide transporter